MKAVWVEGGQVEVREMPIPAPCPGEALIKVLRAGICNTDLEIVKGYMGFSGVLGHEFVGVVEAVCPADHDHPLMGKRVVGGINLACQTCSVCEKGGDRARNHCPNRTTLGILQKDGTMAEYLTLPLVNLLVVPENVSDEAAVFAEPLAAAFRIVEQGLVTDGTRTAIIGDGKLGLMIAVVIRSLKLAHRPVLFGHHADNLALVADANLDTRHITSHSQYRPFDGTFDVCIDATGSPNGLETARSLVHPLGTVVLKTTCASGAEFNAAPIVIDEIRVVGSRCGPLAPALALLNSLDTSPFYTASFPLFQVREALDKAREKGSIKVQIICTSRT